MSEEQAAQQAPFDHDGFWKDLIGCFWKGLIKRALPELYAEVDFTKEPRFLDKELTDTLQTMESKKHIPPRFVDKLLDVPLKNGRRQWVLLHIEIQGPGGGVVSGRMMGYLCLIFAHYKRMPVALLILTSPRRKGPMDVFELEQYGTRISYHYNCLRLDRLDDEELLASDEPVDLALYAAKVAFRYKKKEQQRFKYLMELTRLLADKGWDLEERRVILLMIVRVLNLETPELCQRYVESLEEMGGNNVAYVTFVEEYFSNKGMAKGIEQGIEQGIERGIEQGRYTEKLETAARMRALGMSDQDIQRITELSPAELISGK